MQTVMKTDNAIIKVK